MKMLSKTSLILAILMCFSLQVDAQKKKRKKKPAKDKVENTEQDQEIKVELKNGSIFVGQLLKVGEDSLIIKNKQFGRVAIANEDVEDYSGFIKPDLDENGWNKEKYQAQYFLSPSARPVGKENVYYTNLYIFVNTISFGISDNFSLNVGFESASIFAGQVPLIWVSPKLSFPLGENLYVGAGTTLFIATLDGDTNFGGLAYVNTTLGSAIKNFSVGVGYAYAAGGTSDAPAFQLGFAVPLSKKISFIGEGFFTSDIDGVFNAGLRIITKNNMIFDAGLLRPLGLDAGVIGIPLLSLSVPF